MPITNRYQTQSQPIASYSYTDLASGTGYQLFNAMTVWTGSTNYALSDSTNIHTMDLTTTTPENTNVTKNFDVLMNTSKYIKGDIIFQIPNYVDNNGANSVDVTTVVGIYVYDGSTETQIGSSVTKAWTSTAGTQTMFLTVGKITATGTVVPSGQYIRLKINLACGGSTNATTTSGIYHDPKETTTLSTAGFSGDTRTSRTIAAIPFKLF